MDMNQCEMILNRLEHGGITPKEAEVFGCMRLAARICELRNRGYNIRTEMRKTEGGSVYALYTMQK